MYIKRMGKVRFRKLKLCFCIDSIIYIYDTICTQNNNVLICEDFCTVLYILYCINLQYVLYCILYLLRFCIGRMQIKTRLFLGSILKNSEAVVSKRYSSYGASAGQTSPFLELIRLIHSVTLHHICACVHAASCYTRKNDTIFKTVILHYFAICITDYMGVFRI